MTNVTSSPQALEAAVDKLLKPGTKTSEFIAMIVVWAAALTTLLGEFNTASPRLNAVLKIAALIAAAVSHVGYTLSRGNVKGALGAIATAAINRGYVIPISTITTGNAGNAGAQIGLSESGSSGYAGNSVLIWILAVVGIVAIVLWIAH